MAEAVKFLTQQGAPVKATRIDKTLRDTLAYTLGIAHTESGPTVPYFWPNPLQNKLLVPGSKSPICQKCGLDKFKSDHPYIEYGGSDNPLITVLYEGVSPEEDERDETAVGRRSHASYIKAKMASMSEEVGLDMARIRWVPLSRCANRSGEKVNLKTKVDKCRLHALQDLIRHRPRLILAVGTVALGALSHKSNAQDWSGKLLTYRGWPDDWLINPKFARPRIDPADTRKETTNIDIRKIIGHPLFGPLPNADQRIPLFALQHPRLVRMLGPKQMGLWAQQLKQAMKLAVNGVSTPNYDRPWFRITENVDEIEQTLLSILELNKPLVSFDTETNGLDPWQFDSAIVFMMFRWVDGAGKPQALGFPWEFEVKHDGSPNLVNRELQRLTPTILKVLKRSRLIGHNVGFDMLWTVAQLRTKALLRLLPDDGRKVRTLLAQEDYTHPDSLEYHRAYDRHLCALADAAHFDTWHMAYTLKQQRGSLGLEIIAYQYAPEFAGYEEEMTLLIDLYHDEMHPEGKQHGHYANCPVELWDSHLKPYVMGDVETPYIARINIGKKLAAAPVYQFPLADSEVRGRFSDYTPPNRGWVYEKIVSPANRVLLKMRARGMRVDRGQVEYLLGRYKTTLSEKRNEIEKGNIEIATWCEEMRRAESGWALDLERKDQLSHIMFTLLNLPVQRLTTKGRELFGEEPAEWDDAIAEYLGLKDRESKRSLDEISNTKKTFAALDKFTFNGLVAQFPQARDLLAYRKAFKLHSAYLMPMHLQHIKFDSCVHADFLLTGTRSGRLSSRCLPLTTKVFTANGWIRFSDVKVGDYIETPGGFTKVTAAVRTGVRPVLRFSAEHGGTLDCSPDHLILVNGSWLQAKHVKIGDTFKIYPENSEATVTHITEKSPVEMGDITVEAGCFLVNGICVHNSPNLQQLPRDADIKKVFVSRFGKDGCMYQADLSQIELRLLACACGDPEMVRAYRENVDLHTLTTSRIFNVPYEHFSKDYMEKLQKEGKEKLAKSLNEKRQVGKCVDPNTLVSVDGKIIRIGSIHSGREDDKFYAVRSGCIQSPAGFTPLHAFYSNGIRDRLLVCCRQGLLVCSKSHKFQAYDGTLIQADQLKPGTELKPVTPLVNNGGQRATISLSADLSWHAGFGFGNDNAEGNPLPVPDMVFASDENSQLSFIAGIADSQSANINKQAIQISTCSYTLAQDLMVLLTSLSVEPYLTVTGEYDERSNYFTITVPSRNTAKFLNLCRRKQKAAQPTIARRLVNPDVNSVLSISRLDPGQLVEISVADPHLYVPNGLTTKQTSNFLTGYGGGAFGLQTTLANRGIFKQIEECEQIIDAFFSAYPSLKAHLQYYKYFIKSTGVASSIFGRVRFFPEVGSPDPQLESKALRAGYNHLIQSTASDMMLIALIAIETRMREAGLTSMLVSTVHDSLVADCLVDELQEVHKICTYVLNHFKQIFVELLGEDFDTSWMLVPFTGDSEVGKNYLDCFTIPKKDVDWDEIFTKLR